MTNLLSLTEVTHTDLKNALANQAIAREALRLAVKQAIPKYKDTLNLKWWNFFDNRKTSEELFRAAHRSYWWTPAEILYHVGLIPKGVEIYVDNPYGVQDTVATLVDSNKDVYHVSEAIITFMNKWKTKEA